MCKTIWEEASKWTAYGSDDIINLIVLCDSFPIPLIFDAKSDLRNELENDLWLPKGKKKESKKVDRKKTQHRPSSPEEDAQDVGYEQHQADSGGKALTGAAPMDLLVLWHIGQSSPEHHDAGRQPGQQHPRALHVLLLQQHLCIHHTKRQSGASRCCSWEAKEKLYCNYYFIFPKKAIIIMMMLHLLRYQINIVLSHILPLHLAILQFL